MKLINRDTDYAIRALRYMAEKDKKIVSVSDLVRDIKIPRPFLRKILQTLNNKGLLKSYKGKGGGFQLAHKPDRIFLTDLLEIFHGPLDINECFLKKSVCPDMKTCIFKRKIETIKKYVFSQLRAISVASLLE